MALATSFADSVRLNKMSNASKAVSGPTYIVSGRPAASSAGSASTIWRMVFRVRLRPLSPMNTRTRAPAPHTRRRRRVRPNCSDSPAIQLDFFLGTFAPFFRASDRPMAIAWDLLFTRPPLPPFPDFSVPCFRRLIALLTDLPAAFPYLGIVPPVFLQPVATWKRNYIRPTRRSLQSRLGAR